MVERWIHEIENKFSNILIDRYIIMPNHIHCIINVGADLCVCPQENIKLHNMDGHIGPPLPQMIQWFKTMTTNEYIKGVKNKIYPPFNRKI